MEVNGYHPEQVFTYQGRPIRQLNTKAWHQALAGVEIKNFRWHDLRHTSAFWPVMKGSTLAELQGLGG